MDTQSDKRDEQTLEDQIEASKATPTSDQSNGASKNGHQDLAAWYLEDLRAMRRTQSPGSLRIFNPDETPAEREVRIRETLAGLKAMQELAAAGTEEDGRVWDEVMKAVERSRSGSSGPDSGTHDS